MARLAAHSQLAAAEPPDTVPAGCGAPPSPRAACSVITPHIRLTIAGEEKPRPRRRRAGRASRAFAEMRSLSVVRLPLSPWLLVFALCLECLQLTKGKTYTYPTFAEHIATMERLAAEYPNFLRLDTAQKRYGLQTVGTCPGAEGSQCLQHIMILTNWTSLEQEKPIRVRESAHYIAHKLEFSICMPAGSWWPQSNMSALIRDPKSLSVGRCMVTSSWGLLLR